MTAGSHAPTLRTLLALAWPVILSRATQSVIGISDALMCHHLGPDALAAVLTGALNTFWVLILPWGTVFIVQSFAAQLTGRGDRAGARRFAWYGLVLAAVSGLLGTACIPLVPHGIGLFGYEAPVAAAMTGYVQIRLWSAAPAIGIEALGSWFGGLGNTRIHLVANTTAMLLNVPLNWLLIRGGLGIPALGVDGAALASVLATTAAFAVMLVALWRFPRHGAMGRLSMGELWRVLRFGLPNGANWFLEFAAFAVFLNAIVPQLGTEAVAAMGVVLNVNSISFMPSFGLSSAGAILVGQAIGQGQRERVPGILLRTFGVAAAWQVMVGAVYVAWPQAIIARFADQTQEKSARMLALGATMLALSSAWQLFDAAAMAISEALRAAGDTAFCMYARLLVAWTFFAPLAWLWIGKLGGRHEAAIWSIVAYLAVLSLVFLWRFWSGAWKRIELVEPAVD